MNNLIVGGVAYLLDIVDEDMLISRLSIELLTVLEHENVLLVVYGREGHLSKSIHELLLEKDVTELEE